MHIVHTHNAYMGALFDAQKVQLIKRGGVVNRYTSVNIVREKLTQKKPISLLVTWGGAALPLRRAKKHKDALAGQWNLPE